jgi:uncharacterized membrane protein YuzA (DUF378 family)
MLNNLLYNTSLTIVLIGGLHLLLVGFGINLFNYITSNYKIEKYIYLFIGIITLYVIIFHYRKLYLSFLEETFIPPNMFENKINKFNNRKIIIDGINGKKIIYWSARPLEKEDNLKYWKDAYNKYENSGIVDIIDNKAEILFSTPVRYRVGFFNKLLPRHIHYRILYDNGFLSRIYTINI